MGGLPRLPVLKRERGQVEGSLFVTGRAIEREQQPALSFDAAAAQWTPVGNAAGDCAVSGATC
jgi:hypothetical protein